METLVLKVDPQNPAAEVIKRAGDAIRRGELVAFPTETVYGLGADAFNKQAVLRVYEVKGRPANNALPVQVASKEDVLKLAAEVPDVARRLMERFFPGSLTLVLRASPDVPDEVTAGTGKVGIRIPDHPVALALIRAAGTSIVAPSANVTGQPPPTTAEEALEYLGGRIELVLDAGPTRLKVASTVVDVTEAPLRILRRGSISEEMLAACLKAG
ncbi:MAG TPA: L-threonylcarbamoyladenylate synthase [Armatimonadota bacterium]|nr:L-threonylcarbamoyladenylate synthase [Armatimonadota bacterium]